jgi:hypothetical protein
MYSEWLDDRPSDFETNWIMALCPVGKRCLVVAKEVSVSYFFLTICDKIHASFLKSYRAIRWYLTKLVN